MIDIDKLSGILNKKYNIKVELVNKTNNLEKLLINGIICTIQYNTNYYSSTVIFLSVEEYDNIPDIYKIITKTVERYEWIFKNPVIVEQYNKMVNKRPDYPDTINKDLELLEWCYNTYIKDFDKISDSYMIWACTPPKYVSTQTDFDRYVP